LQSRPNLYNFGGSSALVRVLPYCTDTLLPIRAKFGVLEQTCGVRLHAKVRLDRFIF